MAGGFAVSRSDVSSTDLITACNSSGLRQIGDIRRDSAWAHCEWLCGAVLAPVLRRSTMFATAHCYLI